MLVTLIAIPAILVRIFLLCRVPYLRNVIINNLTLHTRAMRGCRNINCTLLNMAMVSNFSELVVHCLMCLTLGTKLLRL